MRCRCDCQPFFADEFSSGYALEDQKLRLRAHPGCFRPRNLPALYKVFTPLLITGRENQHPTPEIKLKKINSRDLNRESLISFSISDESSSNTRAPPSEERSAKQQTERRSDADLAGR